MKHEILRQIITFAFVLITTPAIVLMGTVPADAAGTIVEIPVKVTFSGSNLPSETFVVECTRGESGELVMREVTLPAGRKTETIIFEETLQAGIYGYTVREAAGTDSEISYSDRIYTVNVMVNSDGAAEMSVTDQDAQEKPDQIIFENKYDAPESPVVDYDTTSKGVSTGDNALVWPLAAALLAAVIALIVIIVKRRKDDS